MDPSQAIFRSGQSMPPQRCELASRLSAYHDGELDAAAAAEVERHLAACEPCRIELQELRELSAMAATLGTGQMSSFGMSRIHAAIDVQPTFSVLRIAGILTGLAASVLVVGSAWLFEAPQAHPAAAQQVIVVPDRVEWVNVAINLQPDPLPQAPWEVRDRQMLANNRFTDWVVEGLSGR